MAPGRQMASSVAPAPRLSVDFRQASSRQRASWDPALNHLGAIRPRRRQSCCRPSRTVASVSVADTSINAPLLYELWT
jgi:hypothetical protein